MPEASRLFAHPSLTAEILGGLGIAGQLRICIPGDFDLVRDWLRAIDELAYFEPNAMLTTSDLPGDERFDAQWALDNTGQTGRLPNANINT